VGFLVFSEMADRTENIHPIFEKILQRADKEKLLGQRGTAIWLTGLSGSGKSTIAQHLETLLHGKRFFVKLLDGDNMRFGINKNLGFSEEDRLENIRRVAEITKLFVESGVITINSFISPTESIRTLAKSIIGEADFNEVFVDCPLEVCEKRDVKGLYKKARAGEIKNFTGIDSVFESPDNPAFVVNTGDLNIEESVKKVYEFILKKTQ
jgi:adenylylsulfate kinase